MTPEERALLNYLFLADVAQQKHQLPGRNRFLALGVKKAGDAGLLTVAERCRTKVIRQAPHHLLVRYDNAAEALRSEDFVFLVRQLERGCPPERAEQLAAGLNFEAETALQNAGGDLKQLAETLLQDDAVSQR